MNFNESDFLFFSLEAENERLSVVSHPQQSCTESCFPTWSLRSSSASHAGDCETLMFGDLNLPELCGSALINVNRHSIHILAQRLKSS